MAITVIPLPIIEVLTVNGELITASQFIRPDGSSVLSFPDGDPRLGRSVELQGEGEFVGTELRDSIFGADNLSQTVFGLGGDDSAFFFGQGSVTFSGNDGEDSFEGGLGNDTFYGGNGEDNGNGGEGEDLLFGDLGDDRLTGGLGDDTLFGGLGDDQLTDGSFVDPEGSQRNNVLFGGQGNDMLSSALGNDFLSGDLGNDEIVGDGGNDTLSGGEGFDLLTGGSNLLPSMAIFTGDEVQDIFAVEVNNDFDLVTDFEDGIDKLGLPSGVTFEDLLIAPLEAEAELINQQSNFEDITISYAADPNDPNSEIITVNVTEVAPTDIAIRLAATDQLIAVLNADVGGDPTVPVLDVSDITAEDFVSL